MVDVRAELIKRLNALSGKLCWAVTGGKGTGSIITLDFGNKIPRKIPLQNQHISIEKQKFNAETSLVIYCAWRVDSAEYVLCGSNDSTEEDGVMLQGLKKIVGTHVQAVTVTFPGYDLSIEFNNGLTLHLFCTMMDAEVDGDNYVLFEDGYAFGVSSKSIITCEE